MGDYRTTIGEKVPLTTQQRSQRLRRGLLTGGVAAVVVLAAGFLLKVERTVPAEGYVTSEAYAEIRPAVAAAVLEIGARSGEQVQAGQLLLRLDDENERTVWNEAESRVLQTVAELARRATEVAERRRRHRDETAMAELRWANAVARRERMEELLAGGLISEAQLNDQRLNVELARLHLQLLQETDEALFEQELEVLRQELAARREAAARAQARLRAREVRAPITGRVLRYHFVPGEIVRPDNVLYEIFGGERQMLRLRLAEGHAARVRPGLPYRARLSSHRGYPRHWFHGEVEGLRHVVQSEGDRTYRVAFCSLDPEGEDIPMGTTAEARIHYARTSLWAFLLGL